MPIYINSPLYRKKHVLLSFLFITNLPFIELVTALKQVLKPQHYWRLEPDGSLWWGPSYAVWGVGQIPGLRHLGARNVPSCCCDNQECLRHCPTPTGGQIGPQLKTPVLSD